MDRRKINDYERGSEALAVLHSLLSYGDNLHYEKFSNGSVKCIEDEIPFDTASRIYKDIIFDTSPVAGKMYKIAKTAGNKAFLAVFAVFVGVQFAPSEHSHGVPDADIWAPAQLAQGIIKMYAKIKWFGQN